jgi:hypothetical protein
METYSVSVDFKGVIPNIRQLHNEIINNINITKTLNGVSKYADAINIEFNLTLSSAEKTTLNSIVTAHIPIYIPITPNRLQIYCGNSLKNPIFTLAGTNIFIGSTYATASAISYMDPGITSYTIRIFDKTNKVIILDSNLTNTIESIQNLGVLSNLPTTTSQLEVLIKKNGGGVKDAVYIENVIIYFI